MSQHRLQDLIEEISEEPPPAEAQARPPRLRQSDIVRAMLFPVALAGLLLLARELGLRELGASRAEIERLLARWGVWGPVVFIAAYSVLPLVFVPRSLLALIGGYLFGWASVPYTWAGALIGESAAFWLAGLLLRPLVEKTVLSRGRARQVVEWIRAEGFWAVCVLRLMPFMPTDVVNFGSGVGGIRYRAFAAGTLLGILPGCVLFSYYGQLFQGDPAAVEILFVIPLFAIQLGIGLAVAQWRFGLVPVRTDAEGKKRKKGK